MQVRLLTSFGGFLGQYDSPSFGTVIDVSEELAAALCDDGRAEYLESAGAPIENAATSGAPEVAMKRRGRARG